MKTLILFLFVFLAVNVSAKEYLPFAPKHSKSTFSKINKSFNKTFKYRTRRYRNRVNQSYYQYEHSNPRYVNAYENWNRRPKCNRFFKLFK